MPIGGASLRGSAEFCDQVGGAVARAWRRIAGIVTWPVRSPLHAHRGWLLDQVAATPGLTLAEVRERLAAEHGLMAGIAAIWSFFRREGISFKKNAAALRAGQARRCAQASELAALPRRDRA